VGYDCIVCAKQVPDTKRITGQAMKDDGTVNRAALPAIFNPEDLNALETALEIRDQYGGRVTLITMGLPAASEILREGLYRGVDQAILLTDRRAAASDTLATSYILACAIRKLPHDIVLCGRQAIDGDTAQVGPQLAQKLGLPQITYLEELAALEGRSIRVKRNIGNGYEMVKAPLPVLLTVMETANSPRPPAARKLMKYKKARTPSEVAAAVTAELGGDSADPAAVKAQAGARCQQLAAKGLLIKQWNLDDIAADLTWCGRSGSPTKVHRIQSVVLTASGYKQVPPTDEGISELVAGFIEDHTIG
jgi:electron transfer flavoprotein beta subunit